MIVLDAHAVLALLKGEPAGPRVRDLLQGEHDARLTALGVSEVVDHLVRLSGACEDEAALDLGQLGLAETEARALLWPPSTPLRSRARGRPDGDLLPGRDRGGIVVGSAGNQTLDGGETPVSRPPIELAVTASR